MPRGKRGRAESVVHEVAGSFDQRGQIACILCGKILLDYSDAQIEFDGTRTKGMEPERPLPPGPVTVTRAAGSTQGGTVKVGALFGAKRCTELEPFTRQGRASKQPRIKSGHVRCLMCEQEWLAHRPEGTKELECPCCHLKTEVEELD